MNQKYYRFFLIFAFSLSWILGDTIKIPAEQPWRNLSPGIDFQIFELPDPNQVFVTRMDRSNKNVTIETGLAYDKLAYGRETVREIVRRNDDTLGYWGEKWGVRKKVIAAINGYYFDQDTGTPWRGQAQSAWYIKRFDNFQNGSGIVWKLNGEIFIGGCISHPPAKQTISFENDQSQKFNGINQERGKDQLIIYTSHYSDTTGTDNSGVEVLVEMDKPLLIGSNSTGTSGTIKQIFDHRGSSTIPFNAIILSASGTARDKLISNVKIGQKISISQQISHFESDCRTPNPDNWSNAYTAIGGDFIFLKTGEIQYFDIGSANVRAPRTAVAYNDEYIYFIVVDGRDPDNSVGMSMRELAEFSKTYLDARWGISEDSGGSSTMVINGEVVNNTYCNFNDCTQLPQTNEPGNGTSSNTSTGYQTISESFVGNALMMVKVYPPIISKTFTEKNIVITNSETQLYSGPGINYTQIASIPKFANLRILPSYNDLDGIYAQGSFWWYVEYQGHQGWISENNLIYGIVPANFIFKPFFFDNRKR
ncbi:MAG: phosphodiester glycosidase family protein [Chloroflexi bacterium]|nr:phosphodiester glycosidase family protein [Chloroflexota bacterium]